MTSSHEHAHEHVHEPEPGPEHQHEHHHHEPLDYGDAVRSFRTDKDEYFRSSPGSPIPEAGRADFKGLSYFGIDEGLRFEGLALEPYGGDEPTSFTIPTSDGKLRPAERAGTLRFAFGSVPAALTAYTFQHDHSGSVFVPFLDETSGAESYRLTKARVDEGVTVQGPCFVDDGAVVKAGARIGPYAVVGRQCHIEEQAVIEPKLQNTKDRLAL